MYTTILRILLPLLATGIMLASLGCGRVPSYENAIVVAIGDNSIEDAFKRMVGSFEGASKPVRVELQGAQDYGQWMALQFIGRRPPSVISCGTQLSWTYGAHEGVLVALNPYLDQVNPVTGQPWRDQFLPGVLDVVTAHDGNVYVIPFDVVKVAFFYNKNLFQALDLVPPTTWAEFMEVCRRIDEDSERVLGRRVTPCAVGNSMPSGAVVWTLGTFCDSLFRPLIPLLDIDKRDRDTGEILPKDGFVDTEELTRGYYLGIIDPMGPEFASMWRLYKDWSRYWVGDFNAMADMDVRPRFLQQTAAIAMDGSWWCKTLPRDLNNVAADRQFEFDVFPLPPVTDESYPHFNHPFGSLGSVGNGLSVAKYYGEETIEEAVALVRHISTPPVILEASAHLNLPTVYGYDLPSRYEGFRPLFDGTFPFLRFVEGWFPDPESEADWFALFQQYLDDRLDFETYQARVKQVIDAGVQRAIVRNRYDTDWWEQQAEL